ncbi:MAG: ParB/RepB/Spo0J family partition protein [Melioribacteraceae bacterium]
MAELKEVKIEKIVFSKTNPRKEFNKNSLQELADSIKSNGLVNPVTLRKKGSNYELVSGERRVRACKLIKKKTVLSIIKDLSDEQVLEIQYIENLQRQDVHPLDEATFIQGMLETGKYTIETIADKIGKSISYVSSRYRLIWLIKDAHKLYAEGKIELGHALLIAKMQEDAQQKLLKYISQSFRVPTVSELRVQVAGLMPNLNEAPFNRKDKLLLPDAGSCFECKKRTGNAVDLFTEFSGNNICTDGSCYKEKVNLHMAMQIDKADESGTPLVRISGVNYGAKKNVLGQNEYTLTKKPEGKGVQKAIYTDGPQKGKVIDIVVKTIDVKSVTEKVKTDKEKLFELNLKIKAQRDEAYHEHLSSEFLKQDLTTAILPNVIFDLLMIDGWISEHFMDGENLAQYRGWIAEGTEITHEKLHKVICEKIFGMSPTELNEILNQSFILSICAEQDFLSLAKRFNINTAEIKKKVEEELPLLKKLPGEQE